MNTEKKHGPETGPVIIFALLSFSSYNISLDHCFHLGLLVFPDSLTLPLQNSNKVYMHRPQGVPQAALLIRFATVC